MSRRLLGSLAMAALLSSVGLVSNDARACGGCFTGGGESTIVTSHRMALSISTERTVLWDQIRYQGDPEEFAWVLPVRPGATIELGSDAFFEALDAATNVNVFRPQGAFCSGGYDDWDGDYYGDDYGKPSYFGACSMAGCAAEGAGRDSHGAGGGGEWGDEAGGSDPGMPSPVVEVVHEASIGPYEAVILSSNEPGALYDWLLSHGYAIDPDMEPVIDGYEADGFDFVALRLIPGASVRQMTPVRITSPGAAPVLPLKMVAAGTGASVGMTLFLLGEGRWEAQEFPNALVDTGSLVWDFATSSSNYGELRAEALDQHHGALWLTTYSKPNALLSPVLNPVSMQYTQYSATNGSAASSIAGLYAAQGYANGEIADLSCVGAFEQIAMSTEQVTDPCAPTAPDDPSGAGGAGGAMSGGGADPGGAGGAGGAMSDGGAGGRFPGGDGNSGGRFPSGAGGAGGAMSGGAGGAGTGGAGGEPECAGTVESGQIDARGLSCGPLDDIAVALVGMHPADVWVTRMEAELPRRALSKDLVLQASLGQYSVENWMYSSAYTGDPCAAGATPVPPPRPAAPRRGPPLGGRDLVALGTALAFLMAVAARRHLRPLRAARARS